MPSIIGGWDNPEVSAAQLALVVQELSEPEKCGPFSAFLWAMDAIVGVIGQKCVSLLDVGCGVGHYGVLCERFYPSIRYCGTDLSETAIGEARRLAPLGTFSVCEFSDNRFGDYDIVLTGQTMEMTDDPPGALDMLMLYARGYVILNRIRLTPEKSHRIKEATYCGNMGQTWLWNLDEIMQMIGTQAKIEAMSQWQSQVTFVLRKDGDD